MAREIQTRDTASLSRLLSVPELAEYLGVPVSTLYLWRTQGVGATGFRVGKQLRYRVDDVLAWLKRQANQTP